MFYKGIVGVAGVGEWPFYFSRYKRDLSLTTIWDVLHKIMPHVNHIVNVKNVPMIWVKCLVRLELKLHFFYLQLYCSQKQKQTSEQSKDLLNWLSASFRTEGLWEPRIKLRLCQLLLSNFSKYSCSESVTPVHSQWGVPLVKSRCSPTR